MTVQELFDWRVKYIQANYSKFSNWRQTLRETSVVIELGAEKCNFSGGSLKRNLLVALPEPPEQQKPKKKEEEKQDIPSFALDGGITGWFYLWG